MVLFRQFQELSVHRPPVFLFCWVSTWPKHKPPLHQIPTTWSLNLSIKSRQDSYNMHAPLVYNLYYSLIFFTPKCTTRCAVASRQIKLWKWWVGDFLDWSETQSDLNSAITKVMFKYDRRERMLPSHALSFTMIWGFQWEEFSN